MTTTPATGAPHSTPNHKRPPKMASSQSLNHLLNFSLPPRQSHQPQHLPRRRKQGANQAVWNKERFVNAQYRFVMNPAGDYTVHFADPDIYFQWQDILQILVPRTSALAIASNFGEQSAMEDGVMSCPICLSPPTAPRMTKCGHIFCYPCILHYFTTSDNTKWARCPVCLDTVNEKQLKVVNWIDNLQAQYEEDENAPTASSSSATAETANRPPAPGSTLRMRLIQRPLITTLALPRSPTWPSDLLPPHQAPFHFLPDVYTFSKFMIATPTALIADLIHDLDELATERRLLASMHDDLGVSFVDAADAKVRLQMAKASALENLPLKETIETTHSSLQELLDRAALHDRRVKEDQVRHAPVFDVPEEFLASQTSGFGSAKTVAAPTSAPPEPQGQIAFRGPKQRRNVNPPPSTSSYYFYQAASGMPIFLHALDIKILLVHFGSYSAFPDTITVRVEAAAETTVNEDLRKRFKYLAHLPEGQDVVFVETDPEGIVGRNGLKHFERALTTRRSRREQRGKKDDKARVRAEEREKERVVQNWNELTKDRVDAYIPPPPRVPSPMEADNAPEQGQEPPASAPQMAGAWGARSFASAAQRAAPPPAPSPPRRTPVSGNVEDEWELDAAFHELEQRAGRGGGRRKNNRMVVLGGGGGRRR